MERSGWYPCDCGPAHHEGNSMNTSRATTLRSSLLTTLRPWAMTSLGLVVLAAAWPGCAPQGSREVHEVPDGEGGSDSGGSGSGGRGSGGLPAKGGAGAGGAGGMASGG